MRWHKSPTQYYDEWYPLHTWGAFTRYLEIGDDLYATRQVDVFANGNMLRYDRDHCRDDFEGLAELRYSDQWDEWWGPSERISRMEFEQLWQAVEASPTYAAQLRSRWPEYRWPWAGGNNDDRP